MKEFFTSQAVLGSTKHRSENSATDAQNNTSFIEIASIIASINDLGNTYRKNRRLIVHQISQMTSRKLRLHNQKLLSKILAGLLSSNQKFKHIRQKQKNEERRPAASIN